MLNAFHQTGLCLELKRYFSPSYREPSLLGRGQRLASLILGHGPLRPWIESYVLYVARR